MIEHLDRMASFELMEIVTLEDLPIDWYDAKGLGLKP